MEKRNQMFFLIGKVKKSFEQRSIQIKRNRINICFMSGFVLTKFIHGNVNNIVLLVWFYNLCWFSIIVLVLQIYNQHMP